MRVSPTPGRKLKDIYRYVFGGKRDYLRDFVVEELPSSGVFGGIQKPCLAFCRKKSAEGVAV